MARPKGADNRRSIAIKQMIEKALDRVGGEDYFVKQATENPAAFMTLVGRAMPKEVEATIRKCFFEEIADKNLIDAEYTTEAIN